MSPPNEAAPAKRLQTTRLATADPPILLLPPAEVKAFVVV
jgi:hypothetical protein